MFELNFKHAIKYFIFDTDIRHRADSSQVLGLRVKRWILANTTTFVLMAANPAHATTTCYSYDELGQLTAYRTVGQTDTALTYDNTGNPVQVTAASDPPLPPVERGRLFLKLGGTVYPIPTTAKSDVCDPHQPQPAR